MHAPQSWFSKHPVHCFPNFQCMLYCRSGKANILYIAYQTFNACFTADLVKQTSCTLLPKLSMHALLQIWVKPSAEMQYMYGNHVLKSGLGRITENTPAYTGVVIYSMSDIPLGFGVTAKSTADCRKMNPSGIVVFHQADVGEALRPVLLCRLILCFVFWSEMLRPSSVLLQVNT